MNKLELFFFRLQNSCEFSDTFLYWMYEKITRSLECKCCIFYRGLATGFIFGMVWCFVLINLFIWVIAP